MKKLISILLALLITVSLLTGCSTIQDQVSKILGNGDASKDSVERGFWLKDGLYWNKFMDVAFTEPDGWEHSSDEQIADIFDVPSSSLKEDGTFDYDLEKEQFIYDMFSLDSFSGDSVTIMYEKLYVTVTLDEYLEIAKEQALSVDATLTVTDEGYLLIGEKMYSFFEVTYGSTDTVQIYAVRSIGKHMAVILITDVDKNDDSKDMVVDSFILLREEQQTDE